MPLTVESSLSDVRAYIAGVAAPLDPMSRYLPELLKLVDASRDAADLVDRLTEQSRGARHAGRTVFEAMTLEEKLRCNLVTNETVLFRFSEGEWEALQILVGRLKKDRTARILCAPCSHGEEAFSLAAACLHAGAHFAIDARDIQPACIESARQGRLTMGFPEEYLLSPAVVSRTVLDRVDFAVADLLVEPGNAGGPPAGPFELVVCRNFLGYFVESVAVRIARGLARRVAAGGALFLDSFAVQKFGGLGTALEAEGVRRREHAPVFVREG